MGLWFAWAIGASFFAAVLAEFNRRFRLEPQLLNAWRSTFAFGIIALAIPLMQWPSWEEHRNFYLVAAIDGVVKAIGMILFLTLAARKTGRVTSMTLPVAAIGAYATWWLIMPGARPELIEKPVQVTLAVLSIVTIILALQKIRRNDNSWESFVIILPVGLAFGIADALTKWVLLEANGVYAMAIAYTFLSVFVCAVTAWVAAFKAPTGGRTIGFMDRKLLWGGFWCGFWTAGMYLALTFSLSLAPNPTYPGIAMALTPVWLYALNRAQNTYDDANPIASIMIMLAAVGLLLSTL